MWEFGDIFMKNEHSEICHFKENNEQYLLPVIKLELSREKLEFWKTCIYHHDLDGNKDFSDQIRVKITVILMLYNVLNIWVSA